MELLYRPPGHQQHSPTFFPDSEDDYTGLLRVSEGLPLDLHRDLVPVLELAELERPPIPHQSTGRPRPPRLTVPFPEISMGMVTLPVYACPTKGAALESGLRSVTCSTTS